MWTEAPTLWASLGLHRLRGQGCPRTGRARPRLGAAQRAAPGTPEEVEAFLLNPSAGESGGSPGHKNEKQNDIKYIFQEIRAAGNQTTFGGAKKHPPMNQLASRNSYGVNICTVRPRPPPLFWAPRAAVAWTPGTGVPGAPAVPDGCVPFGGCTAQAPMGGHSEVVFDWGSPIWYHSQVAFVVGGVTFLGPFSGGFSLGFPYLEPVSSAFLLGFPYFETQLEDPDKHPPREFVTIP